MKKSVSVLLLLAVLISILSGCAAVKTEDAPDTGEQKKEPLKIFTLQGPTGMGLSKLISDSQDKKTDIDCDIKVCGSADEFKGDIIQGNFDVACVPTNLAAVLYQKTNKKISVAAVNTLGVLYVLEKGDTVHSAEDLSGKTVYMAGQGNVPEYAMRYLAEKSNIKCDIVFETEHDVVVSDLISGKADIVLLPEPKVSAVLKNPEAPEGVRIALDLEEIWSETVSGTDLCMGCVIVNRDTLEKSPEAINAFLDEYKKSVDFINTDESAADIIVKTGIIPKAPIAKSALPNSNIVFITGDEMKEKLGGFLEVLHSYNPASVGGELPDGEFYYER